MPLITNPSSLQITDGISNATIRDLTANDALNVAIVDGSGNQITSFGGATQYTEDAASAGGESLMLVGAIRQDTLASSTSLDGDYANLKTNSLGRLYTTTSIENASIAVTGPLTDAQLRATAVPVSGTFWQATQPVSGTVTANAGTNLNTSALGLETTQSAIRTATELMDNVVVVHDAVAVTSMNMTGGLASSTAPTAVVNGDAARLWTTLNGALNIADGGTTISIDDGAGSITVDGTFWQATQPVSIATMPTTPVTGTFWQTTQPVSIASLPSQAVTNAGTFAVQVTSIAAGTNNIGDVDVLSIIPGTGTTNLGKQTDSAAGATDTGVAILAIRDDALTTLTPIDGDYTRFRVNSLGRLWASATIDAAIPAGTNNIGDVDIVTMPNVTLNALPAGSNSIGNIGTVSTVTNLSQLGGTAIAMNTGVRSAGTQRVTIATDDIVGVKMAPDASASFAPSNATTTVYASSLVIKASAGTLYSIVGYNSGPAQFIQVYNSATLPADGVAPVVLFRIYGDSNFSLDLSPYGRYFSTGIVIGNSTTGPTKTIGAANCWFDAQFM